MKTIIYTVNHPFITEGRIEVYGEADMGWYEWRIIDKGAVSHDTAREGNGQGLGYGSPEIALRDALVVATDDTI